jgi:hypothetical protein
MSVIRDRLLALGSRVRINVAWPPQLLGTAFGARRIYHIAQIAQSRTIRVCFKIKMHRLLAITIVLLFGLPLAAPLFAVDAARSLPECCRRNGRHQCVAGMVSDPGNRTISTIAPKCPSWPKSAAVTWPNGLASAQTQSIRETLFAHPESAPQSEARYRVAFVRSRQKRGPPAILWHLQ